MGVKKCAYIQVGAKSTSIRVTRKLRCRLDGLATKCTSNDSADVIHEQYKVISTSISANGSEVVTVQKRTNDKVFLVRKCLHVTSKKGKEYAKPFPTDEMVKIRDSVGHRHVIKIQDAYCYDDHHYLILGPKANEGTLAEYLQRFLTSKEILTEGQKAEKNRFLERAFGCMASGLKYMHNMEICHKDIRPSNIMIHNGTILYSKLGYVTKSEHGVSLDASSEVNCYHAPDAIGNRDKGFHADIFSLGCVFIEMLFARAVSTSITRNEPLCKFIDDLHDQMASMVFPAKLRFLPNLLTRMTATQPEKRLKADGVCHDIFKRQGFGCYFCWQEFAVLERNDRWITKKTSTTDTELTQREIPVVRRILILDQSHPYHAAQQLHASCDSRLIDLYSS